MNLKTQLTRFATVAVAAWIATGGGPFTTDIRIAALAALLLALLIDVFDMIPSKAGVSA